MEGNLEDLRPGGGQNLFVEVCNNLLPTKENLFKMTIVQDPLCLICELVAETIGHIIWSCSSSTDVWVDCNRKI